MGNLVARPAGFIGESPAMLDVYSRIERVANSVVPVFISGESGTGKEICAEAIHTAGPRAMQPFIAVNCAAIPSELVESQLFGHVKGAFSGAHCDQLGLVRAAEGGTLFLDEICEMDVRLQAKLLRFLQTGTVWPVGATQPVRVDVRIICATNRNVLDELASGDLREDLYYRLSVVPIELPPLRDRGDDCLLLSSAFLQEFAREEGRACPALDADFEAGARQHAWPGNVRELQNVIRRAVVLGDGSPLRWTVVASAPTPGPRPQDLCGLTLEQAERLIIENALARHGGTQSAAARQLSISPSTLYRKQRGWHENKRA